jgi:hypothetical protein
MGWVLGVWKPGFGVSAMPPSPARLNFGQASSAYLQTLTAYFFPTVTTQIANVLCKRSLKTSLFSKDLLSPDQRRERLEALADWRPGRAQRSPRDRHRSAGARIAAFLDNHPVLFNLVSNPVIDLGILFELLLCYVFFYTPLSRIYYFAPVPWHVYLFAFHGTVLLLVFEETKKYFRRKGYALEALG